MWGVRGKDSRLKEEPGDTVGQKARKRLCRPEGGREEGAEKRMRRETPESTKAARVWLQVTWERMGLEQGEGRPSSHL